MARVRKALVAALGAAVSAAVGAVVKDGMPENEAEWVQLACVVVGAGVVAGWAVWKVKNAPAVTS